MNPESYTLRHAMACESRGLHDDGRTTHSVPAYTARTQKPSLNLSSVAEMAVSIFTPGRTAKCAGNHIIARHAVYAAWGLVTTVPGRMKAFLTLLAVTSVTFPLASLPILPVLKSHVVAALAVSHADTWITDVWCDRPYYAAAPRDVGSSVPSWGFTCFVRDVSPNRGLVALLSHSLTPVS
ncbi:hypothetical protein EDB89DRAFT_823457 [Lactarius sanguifluus]|nr:hypothetical protein EDB89DRAFT_823457 [Lactarius sanguifluus]